MKDGYKILRQFLSGSWNKQNKHKNKTKNPWPTEEFSGGDPRRFSSRIGKGDAPERFLGEILLPVPKETIIDGGRGRNIVNKATDWRCAITGKTPNNTDNNGSNNNNNSNSNTADIHPESMASIRASISMMSMPSISHGRKQLNQKLASIFIICQVQPHSSTWPRWLKSPAPMW